MARRQAGDAGRRDLLVRGVQEASPACSRPITATSPRRRRPASARSPSRSTVRAIASCRRSSASSTCCRSTGGKAPTPRARSATSSATTLEPPLGSGAYRIKEFVAGRTIVFERVKDYWGKDLNVNIGRDNFDEMRYEYFRDSTVALEAFKGDVLDWRTENTREELGDRLRFPGRQGQARACWRNSRSAPRGVMQAFVFNTRRDKFKDPRVRLAMNYAFDFEEMNKQLFFGQYKRIASYFEGTELACVGPAGRQGARNPRNRARQGAAGSLHQAVHQSGRRHAGERAREPARGAAAAEGSRLRGPQPEAHQRQDRRAVRDRVPHRPIRTASASCCSTSPRSSGSA